MTFVDDTVYLATVDGNNDCGGAGMLTSMPIRLVIFAYVVLLMLFCLRWGGWGDVNVHAHAACDIRLCLPSYVLLLSLGGGWGGWDGGGMLTSMPMRLVIFAYVFLPIFFCFRGGGGGEGGWRGGMLMSASMIFSMSVRMLLCGDRACFVTAC